MNSTKVGAGEKVKTKNATTKTTTKVNRPPREEWSREAVVKYGRYDHEYEYRLPSGQHAFSVFRRDAANGVGKDIKPWHRDGNRWLNAMPDWASEQQSRPLYRLLSIEATSREQPILIAEGEACCDLILSKYLFTSVTSSGGGAALNLTDWTPLANRRVVILPDNDKAGSEYADAVAKILGSLGCEVYLLRLPELPPKGDVVDWHNLKCAEGMNEADIRAAFNAILSTAEPYRRPVEQIEWSEDDDVGTGTYTFTRTDDAAPGDIVNEYAAPIVERIGDDAQTATDATIVPIHTDQKIGKSGKSGVRDTPIFPVDALGEFLGQWVRMKCESLQVTPGYLATPLLTAIAGAIGDARLLQVSRDQHSFSSLFSLLVCESSSGKSRSLRAVRAPLDRIDDELNAEPGSGPKRKVVVESITDERLVRILANNPSGLVGFYPEGNTFLTERKKYSGNREGHGCDLWMKIFDSDRIVYDRVGQQDDRPDIRIPRPMMSMFLAMTPGSAEPLLAPPYSDSGWTPRLLMAQPDDIIADCPDDEDDDELPDEEREERRRIREGLVRIDQDYERLIRQLWELSPDIDSVTGQRNPVAVRYCRNARRRYMAKWNSLERLRHELEGPRKWTFARMKDNINRVALGLHCASVAMGEHNGNPLEISEQTLNGALAIVDYYCDEALLAYDHGWRVSSSSSLLAGDDLDPDECCVLRWSEGRFQSKPHLQLSEFQKNHKERFPNAESVRIVVSRLVAKGRLRWVKEFTRYGMPLEPDTPEHPIIPNSRQTKKA